MIGTTKKPTRLQLEGETRIRFDDLEPGQVVLGRFCLLGYPEKTASGWRVDVSDLERDYGPGPGHRLSLELCSQLDCVQLEAVAEMDSPLHPRVFAVVETALGTAVLCQLRPRSTADLRGAPRFARRQAVGAVSALLEGLVAVELGVRLDGGDLCFVEGRVCFRGFGHIRSLAEGESPSRVLAAVAEAVGRDDSDAIEPAARITDTPPFVGRERVIEELSRALDDSRRAHDRTIALTGPRGVGRRFALESFARWHQSASVALVADLGRRPGEPGSLLGTLDELPELAEGWSRQAGEALRERLRTAAGPLASSVSRTLPRLAKWLGVAGPAPEVPLGRELDRHAALISALLAAIGTAATPLLLGLVDLDSAELGSLSVIRALASRRLHHTLVIATAEDGAELGSRATCLRLDELTRTEVEALVHAGLDGSVDDAIVSELCALGTLPGKLWPTLRAWFDSGRLFRTREGVWQLASEQPSAGPIALSTVRLSRATPLQIEILQLMAVSDGEVAAECVAELFGRDVDEVARQLDELVELGLVAIRRRRYSLADPSLPDELFAAEESRMAAHRRVATWLAGESGASCSRLAYHQQLGGVGTDVQRASLHRKAGDERLAVFDLERAAWHYHLASQSADSLAQAREGLARVAFLEGRREESVGLFVGAQDAADDAGAKLVIASRACYAVHNQWGIEEAERVATPGLLAVRHRMPSSRAGQVLSILGNFLTLGRRPRLPEPVRDHLCRIYTVFASGFTAVPGKLMLSVLRGARLAGELEAPGPASVLSFWGGAVAVMGRFDKAREIFERAERLGLASGDPWSVGVAKHVRAHWVELPLGHYALGQGLLDEAIASFESTGDLSVAALAYYFKANYGRDRESQATLLGWLDRAEHCAERHQSRLALFNTRSLRALLDARSGTAQRAQLLELSRGLDDTEMIAPDEIVSRAALAHAFLELGSLPDARREVERGRSRLGRGPVVEALVDLFYAGALVAIQAGDRRLYRWSMRRLRRGAKSSSRMALARDYVRALRDHDAGRSERARRRLQPLVREAESRGELGLQARALLLMSRLGEGSAMLESAEQVRKARELNRELGVERSQGTAAVGARRVLPAPRQKQLSGLELVEESRRVTSARGAELRVGESVTDDSTITASRAELGILISHLLISAQQPGGSKSPSLSVELVTLDQIAASKIGMGRAGRFFRFEVLAEVGTVEGPVPGASAIRRSLSAMNGFLDTNAADIGGYIAAFVPARDGESSEAPRGAPSIAVGHPDPRRCATVMSALEMLGFQCHEIVSPLEAQDDTLAFVDRDLALGFRSDTPKVVVLGEGGAGHPNLRVPFDVSELEELIAELLESPSEEAGQTAESQD